MLLWDFLFVDSNKKIYQIQLQKCSRKVAESTKKRPSTRNYHEPQHFAKIERKNGGG
jgi:hypothetical protein